MRVLLVCLLACIGTLVEGQPPAISQNGVTNLASRIPSSLADRAIARGAAFSIQGVRLGANASSTHLELMSSGRSIPIPVRSVQPGQIQAVMPGKAPLGPGSLIVETQDGGSKPFSIRVVPAQPGLFSVNGLGWGQGKIQMLGATGGRKLNSMLAPIRRGGTASIDATGLGSAGTAEVVIGGIPVRALGIDHSASLGLDHIRFQVSRRVPQGCFVPVYVRVASARPSNVVSMAIQDGGSSCQSPLALPQPGSRFGLIGIARIETLYSDSSPPTTMDHAFASFFEPNAADQNQHPLLFVPPEETCAVFYGDAQSEVPSLLASLGSVQGRKLSAGRALSISGSGGVRVIPASPGEPGAYSGRLGLEEPGRPPAPALFLHDPQYTVSAVGGDIGPFVREIPGPPSFEWTNRGELATIDRSQGAAFQWRGVPQDARLLVFAAGVNSVGAAGGVCYCAAKPASGRFTIPAEMLANLPSSQTVSGSPANVVFLIALRTSTDTSVPVKGLDQLWTVSMYGTGRRVTYR
jgi:uncharacterized protein (TIGR03437 family)